MTENPNTGHGHVRPRPDGVKARCGGPGMCRECSLEQAALRGEGAPELKKATEAAPAKVRPKVVAFDEFPPLLQQKRDQIRDMMRARCALPDSPIPPKVAIRAADWIMFLVAMRAYWRQKKGKKPFPDSETLANDIARAAESVETLIIVMQEEAEETLDGIPQILRPA